MVIGLKGQGRAVKLVALINCQSFSCKLFLKAFLPLFQKDNNSRKIISRDFHKDF